MTHKAIFRQLWSDAFSAEAFQKRLHDPAMAGRWASWCLAATLLPRRERLVCRKLITAAGAAFPDIPEPEGGWSDYVLSDATARLYPRQVDMAVILPQMGITAPPCVAVGHNTAAVTLHAAVDGIAMGIKIGSHIHSPH